MLTKKIIGNNFRLARNKYGLSLREVGIIIGVTGETISILEQGKGKYLQQERYQKYFAILSDAPGFPPDLVLDDFLTQDLSGRFTPLPEPDYDIVTSSDGNEALSPGPGKNDLPPGLIEYIGDDMETELTNITHEEIRALKELKNLPWRISKELVRYALADLRRSKKYQLGGGRVGIKRRESS